MCLDSIYIQLDDLGLKLVVAKAIKRLYAGKYQYSPNWLLCSFVEQRVAYDDRLRLTLKSIQEMGHDTLMKLGSMLE